MATDTPTEIYIITANETFQLSKVTGTKIDTPDEQIGGRFNKWGLKLTMSGPPVEERFETEEAAIAAKDAIDDHLTGWGPITEHQRWDTIRKTD